MNYCAAVKFLLKIKTETFSYKIFFKVSEMFFILNLNLYSNVFCILDFKMYVTNGYLNTNKYYISFYFAKLLKLKIDQGHKIGPT